MSMFRNVMMGKAGGEGVEQWMLDVSQSYNIPINNIIKAYYEYPSIYNVFNGDNRPYCCFTISLRTNFPFDASTEVVIQCRIVTPYTSDYAVIFAATDNNLTTGKRVVLYSISSKTTNRFQYETDSGRNRIDIDINNDVEISISREGVKENNLLKTSYVPSKYPESNFFILSSMPKTMFYKCFIKKEEQTVGAFVPTKNGIYDIITNTLVYTDCTYVET